MPEITETTEPDLITEVEELLAKATPGPWDLTGDLPDRAYGVYLPVTDEEGNRYAVAWGLTEYVPTAGFMDQYSEPIKGQASDNMKLVAAAPELLRRLVEEVKLWKEQTESLVAAFDRDDYGDEEVVRITREAALNVAKEELGWLK